MNGITFKQFPLEVSPPEAGRTYNTAPGGSSNLAIFAVGVLNGTPVPSITVPIFPFGNGTASVVMSPVSVTTFATHYCFIPTPEAPFRQARASTSPDRLRVAKAPSDRCTMSTEATPLPSEYGVSSPEFNQDHVYLDARIGDVIVDEVNPSNLIPGGLLPSSLNTYYNVGLPIQSGIPTTTVSSANGKLSVDNTGKVAYATGNEPVSPLNLLNAYTKCEAVITVENGASLVVGADASAKHGVLTVTETSIVHIVPSVSPATKAR